MVTPKEHAMTTKDHPFIALSFGARNGDTHRYKHNRPKYGGSWWSVTPRIIQYWWTAMLLWYAQQVFYCGSYTIINPVIYKLLTWTIIKIYIINHHYHLIKMFKDKYWHLYLTTGNVATCSDKHFHQSPIHQLNIIIKHIHHNHQCSTNLSHHHWQSLSTTITNHQPPSPNRPNQPNVNQRPLTHLGAQSEGGRHVLKVQTVYEWWWRMVLSGLIYG